MVEPLSLVSSQDVAFVNPRACQARLELRTLAEGNEKIAVETVVDCRKCALYERFETRTSVSDIEAVVQDKVGRYLKPNCEIFRRRGITPDQVTTDLLPEVIIL